MLPNIAEKILDLWKQIYRITAKQKSQIGSKCFAHMNEILFGDLKT